MEIRFTLVSDLVMNPTCLPTVRGPSLPEGSPPDPPVMTPPPNMMLNPPLRQFEL